MECRHTSTTKRCVWYGKSWWKRTYENEPYQQQELEIYFDLDYGNIQVSIEEHMSEHI